MYDSEGDDEMLMGPEAVIAEVVEEEVGEDLDRDWVAEDFIPTKVVDEEEYEELPWYREEEVLADENLHVVVDSKDLVIAGKEWGKAFDPMPWPAVDESDEGDVVEAPEEPGEVDKLQLGAQFKTMAYFKEVLADTLIKSHYEVLKTEAKKTIFAAKCHTQGCHWKVRATLQDGRLTVSRYCGDHTCGALTLGSDHTMATAEWIAQKTEGLYDDSRHITPKRLMLHVNKYYGVVPSYKKCWVAKEILVERLEGNHDASFGILPAYGHELKRSNPGNN